MSIELESLPDGGLVQADDQLLVSRQGSARRVRGSRFMLTDEDGNPSLAGNPRLTAGGTILSLNAPLIGGDGGANTAIYSGTSALNIRNAADTATLLTVSNTGAIRGSGTLDMLGGITQNGKAVLLVDGKAADSSKLGGASPNFETGLPPGQNIVPIVKSDGVVEIGHVIDFHFPGTPVTTDRTARLSVDSFGAMLASGDFKAPNLATAAPDGTGRLTFGTNGTYIGYVNNGDLVFWINGLLVARLDASGNLRTRGTVTQNVGNAV